MPHYLTIHARFAVEDARHADKAEFQSPLAPSHLPWIISQLRSRTIFSIPFSCRTRRARASALDSVGKNRPEYGSSLSLTVCPALLRASSSLAAANGSSGSASCDTFSQASKATSRSDQPGNNICDRKDAHVVDCRRPREGRVCMARPKLCCEGSSFSDGCIKAFRDCDRGSSYVDREASKNFCKAPGVKQKPRHLSVEELSIAVIAVHGAEFRSRVGSHDKKPSSWFWKLFETW
jgi:hypothetical protein